MFGDDIVFRRVRGKTVMAKPPVQHDPRVPTAKQKAHVRRFQKAVKFATRMVGNDATRVEYENGIKGRKYTARLVAMSDFFNAPEIESIDASAYQGAIGDRIIVDAIDDFKVMGVSLVITGPDGTMLEQGAAQLDPDDPDRWIYTATAANAIVAGTKIAAQAVDKPGNVTASEIVK